jgi:hypothetical protein
MERKSEIANPKSKMGKLLFVFAGLVLSAPLAFGQYLGSVALQTDQETLATSKACTGSVQTFAVKNVGQSQHYAAAQFTNATKAQFEIDGIDKAGTIYRISDVTTLAAPLSPFGAVQGNGVFPAIQVSVTCSPASATFSLTYSGGSASGAPAVGTYLLSSMDKYVFNGISATANQSTSFQTPFGGTAGTIYFEFTGAGSPSGTEVQLVCSGQNASLFYFSPYQAYPAQTLGLQMFPVPNYVCPNMTVNYFAGTGGATLSLEYVFNPPSFLSTLAATPYHNGAVTAATGVKSSAGNLYGWYIYNPNSSACYLEFFNTSSVTLGTTTPVFAFGIPATSAANVPPGNIAETNFSTAIYIAATTTDGGSTTCTTGMSVNLWYQ